MFNIIRSIDTFGKFFHFRTMGNSKFKTFTGGLITISCFIIIIVFCFLFGKDFLFKKNPRVVSQVVIPNNYPEPFLITNENLVLPWRFFDESSKTLNMTNIIYPIITYSRFSQNSSGQFLLLQQNLEFANCNNKTANVKELNSYYLDDYYCVNWENYNLTFGGSWDAPFIDYFDITLYYCPNSSSFSPEANCTDLNIIKDYFGGKNYTYFEIFYPEYYFVPDDLIDPVKINYKKYFYTFSLNLQKTDRIFFKQVTLEDDQGWILEDILTSSLNSVSEFQSDYFIFNEGNYESSGMNSDFYTFNFYYQKNFDRIRRSYMKFQDLASIIGGFTKIITIFGAIFSNLFYIFLRDEKIYNEIFRFENSDSITNISGEKSKTFTDKNKLSVIPFRHFNRNEIINLQESNTNILFSKTKLFTKANKIEVKSNNIENIIKTSIYSSDLNIKSLLRINENKPLIKQKDKTHNNLRLGTFFYIKRLICFFNKVNFKVRNEKIYSFLEHYFEKRFDVIFYMKSLDTIDRIKIFLFNYHQNLSFDNLKSPNLFDEKEFTILDKEFNRSQEETNVEIIDYFSEKIKNKELDTNDEKVLKILNCDLKNYNFN